MTNWELLLVSVLGLITVAFLYIMIETGLDFWR